MIKRPQTTTQANEELSQEEVEMLDVIYAKKKADKKAQGIAKYKALHKERKKEFIQDAIRTEIDAGYIDFREDIDFDDTIPYDERARYIYAHEPVTVPVYFYNIFEGMNANLMAYLVDIAEGQDIIGGITLDFQDIFLNTGIFPREVIDILEVLEGRNFVTEASINPEYKLFRIFLDKEFTLSEVKRGYNHSLGLPAPGDRIYNVDENGVETELPGIGENISE